MKTFNKQSFGFGTGIAVLGLLFLGLLDTALAGETWNRLSSVGIGVKSSISSGLGQAGLTRASNYFKQDLKISSRIGSGIDRSYSAAVNTKSYLNTSYSSIKGSIGSTINNSYKTLLTSALDIKNGIGTQLGQFVKYNPVFNAKSLSNLGFWKSIGSITNGLGIASRQPRMGTTTDASASSVGGKWQLSNGGYSGISNIRTKIYEPL